MLVSLVPLVIPIPLIFLGLFTSGIQALIFATLSGSLRIIIIFCFYLFLFLGILLFLEYSQILFLVYCDYIGEALEGHH